MVCIGTGRHTGSTKCIEMPLRLASGPRPPTGAQPSRLVRHHHRRRHRHGGEVFKDTHTHNLLTHNLLRHNSHTSHIYSVNAGGDGMECCGFDCRKASQWGLAFLWTYGLDDLWHLECSGALGVLPGADIYGDDATLADPGWPWQRQQPRQCGDHGPGRR